MAKINRIDKLKIKVQVYNKSFAIMALIQGMIKGSLNSQFTVTAINPMPPLINTF